MTHPNFEVAPRKCAELEAKLLKCHKGCGGLALLTAVNIRRLRWVCASCRHAAEMHSLWSIWLKSPASVGEQTGVSDAAPTSRGGGREAA